MTSKEVGDFANLKLHKYADLISSGEITFEEFLDESSYWGGIAMLAYANGDINHDNFSSEVTYASMRAYKEFLQEDRDKACV